MNNYSIEVLKKSAFTHELNSILKHVPLDQQDEEYIIVFEYISKRVKEIDSQLHER
jgi:hypothetical protein